VHKISDELKIGIDVSGEGKKRARIVVMHWMESGSEPDGEMGIDCGEVKVWQGPRNQSNLTLLV